MPWSGLNSGARQTRSILAGKYCAIEGCLIPPVGLVLLSFHLRTETGVADGPLQLVLADW